MPHVGVRRSVGAASIADFSARYETGPAKAQPRRGTRMQILRIALQRNTIESTPKSLGPTAAPQDSEHYRTIPPVLRLSDGSQIARRQGHDRACLTAWIVVMPHCRLLWPPNHTPTHRQSRAPENHRGRTPRSATQGCSCSADAPKSRSTTCLTSQG